MAETELHAAVARIAALEVDMWKGKGPRDPSVTTRLSVVEETMKTVVENMNSLKLWAMGIIATVIAETLVHLFKK